MSGEEHLHEHLGNQIAAGRDDQAFMARLRNRVLRDARLLAKLASVESQVRDLPQGVFAGANRYDTDTEHTLHLWTTDGRSFDVIWPKPGGGE